MRNSVITRKRFGKGFFVLPLLLLSLVVAAHGAQWAKTYGGIGLHTHGRQWANSVRQTSDGGYIVAGATTAFSGLGFNFGWILKLDATGATVRWYVESWDGLGRYAKTDVMSFALSD